MKIKRKYIDNTIKKHVILTLPLNWKSYEFSSWPWECLSWPSECLRNSEQLILKNLL